VHVISLEEEGGGAAFLREQVLFYLKDYRTSAIKDSFILRDF